ncbi:MAG: mechanosensitive ion channel family protein [Halioglobus sp.]
MAEEVTDEEAGMQPVLDYLRGHSDEIVSQAGEYSGLIGDSLGFIAVGMLLVFLLHKMASRFLYSFVGDRRVLTVTFGTLYVLVLVFTLTLVLRKIGIDVSVIGPLAVIVVLFLAVVMYFIIPFFPRLPFMPGHMIEAHGIMGVVDGISTFHTTIRKFDGTMVFIPNAMMVATKILNYSDTPNRRVELQVVVTPDSDLDAARSRLLGLAEREERVLADPAPACFIMNADAAGATMVLYCWVENADFLGARGDMWQALLRDIQDDPQCQLALPQQQVFVNDAR